MSFAEHAAKSTKSIMQYDSIIFNVFEDEVRHTKDPKMNEP